jgi:antirestriction protein
MSDVAYKYIEDSGLLDNCDDVIARYFDYDKFGRDLEIEGSFYYLGGGEYIEIKE